MTSPEESNDGDLGTVTQVIDGDTIEVEIDGRTYRVRYVGVNTPERDEVVLCGSRQKPIVGWWKVSRSGW